VPCFQEDLSESESIFFDTMFEQYRLNYHLRGRICMDKEKVLGTIKSAKRSLADRLNNQYAENLDDEFYQG